MLCFVFVFGNCLTYSLGWPQVCYVVEDGLSDHPECWAWFIGNWGSILELYAHVSTLPAELHP